MTQRMENGDYDDSDDSDGNPNGSDSDADSDADDHNNLRVLNTEPSQAGVIEKISLKNFMCHDSFELTLGPQINFIIGRNGSGKSAILTGISVGLGAKATDTNRGSSIKDLIKDGKTTARTIITLLNEGPKAYMPQEFGSRIIVERKLQRVGAHSYALKSATGKIVSTKKLMLDEILHKFSITIDNPLAFLSQDKAREFLTSTTDQSKYDYFMAGTFIQDIMANFERTRANIVEVERKLKQARAQQEACSFRYKEAAALYNQYKTSDYLRTRLKNLHGKIYWYNVMQVENKLKTYRDLVTQYEAEQTDIRKIIDDLNKTLEEREPQRAVILERKDRLEHKYAECRDAFDRAKATRDRMREEIASMKHDIDNRSLEIRENKNRIMRNEAQIQQEQRRIEAENGGLKDKLLQQQEECKRQHQDLSQQRRDLKEELERLSATDSSPAVRELTRKFREAQQTLQDLKAKREGMRNQTAGDLYAPWGRNMREAVRDIHKTRTWHQMPIGPLGTKVSVIEQYEEWKPLLNKALNTQLDSFVVVDWHDRQILESILRQHNLSKNIIVRRFEKFLFESGKATVGTTFLDMIKVSDENVLYSLIDTAAIEKSVITADRERISQFARSRNVNGVYTLLHRDLGLRASARNGTILFDPIYYQHSLTKFARSVGQSAQEAAQLDKDIAEEAKNIASLTDRLRAAKQQAQQPRISCENQIRAVERQLRELETTLRKIEANLEEDGDFSKIESWRATNEDYSQQITISEGIIASLLDDLEQRQANLHEHKERTTVAKESMLTAQKDEVEVRKEIANFDAEIEATFTNIRHYELELRKRVDRAENASAKISEGIAKLEALTEEAAEKCPRHQVTINPDENHESISHEYANVQSQITAAEAATGRPWQEVQDELLHAKEQRDAANEMVDNLAATCKKLNEELNVRFSCVETTTLTNVLHACRTFESALSLRGFKGRLEFDFEKKSLALLAQLRMDDEMRRIDTLSGGEKSFAQISLLLAIWKVMDLRIRGLDEFDVYMDLVNRSISIKLLLNELREYPESQNIFITPQDIAVVGDLEGANVRIHKMKDPRST